MKDSNRLTPLQTPFLPGGLFEEAEHAASEREHVMDQWLKDNKCSKGTRCQGRVVRRDSGGAVYRYQCQEASETRGYGFSVDSIKEDISCDATVVVFKQENSKGKKKDYHYKVWKWTNPWNMQTPIENQNGRNGLSVSVSQDRVVVTVGKDWKDWDDGVVHLEE